MLGPTLWFLIGVAFFAAELFFPTFITFFFGFGAWAAALASGLGVNLPVALIIFTSVSVSSLLLLRHMLVATFKGRSRFSSGHENATPEDADDPSAPPPFILTGQQATVSRRITPQTIGEVTVGGSFWRATSESEIPEGTRVVIFGHDKENDLLLHVASREKE